jgi:hypothetical protein
MAMRNVDFVVHPVALKQIPIPNAISLDIQTSMFSALKMPPRRPTSVCSTNDAIMTTASVLRRWQLFMHRCLGLLDFEPKRRQMLVDGTCMIAAANDDLSGPQSNDTTFLEVLVRVRLEADTNFIVALCAGAWKI